MPDRRGRPPHDDVLTPAEWKVADSLFPSRMAAERCQDWQAPTAVTRAALMAETPPLVIRDNPNRQRFEADLGEGDLAIAEYELFPDRIVFTHTEVPPQYGGKGIGSALIRFALHSARERGLKVIPICPFFAAYIRKHAEEQDLLTDSWRAKLDLS